MTDNKQVFMFSYSHSPKSTVEKHAANTMSLIASDILLKQLNQFTSPARKHVLFYNKKLTH